LLWLVKESKNFGQFESDIKKSNIAFVSIKNRMYYALKKVLEPLDICQRI